MLIPYDSFYINSEDDVKKILEYHFEEPPTREELIHTFGFNHLADKALLIHHIGVRSNYSLDLLSEVFWRLSNYGSE
jgi:hypothetical protein